MKRHIYLPETIRYWSRKFKHIYSNRLKKNVKRFFGDTWFVEEVSINIGDERHFLWKVAEQYP